MALRVTMVLAAAVLLLTITGRSSEVKPDAEKPEAIRITSGPTVEHTGAEDAIVAWSTNVSSGTQVQYGTDRLHMDQKAETPWGALTHRVTLKHLQPGTTYYYEAISDQALGTGGKVQSDIQQFTTKQKTSGPNQ